MSGPKFCFPHEGIDWRFDPYADLGHQQGVYYALDQSDEKAVAILPDDLDRPIHEAVNAMLTIREREGEQWHIVSSYPLSEALDIGSAVMRRYNKGKDVTQKDLEQLKKKSFDREGRLAKLANDEDYVEVLAESLANPESDETLTDRLRNASHYLYYAVKVRILQVLYTAQRL